MNTSHAPLRSTAVVVATAVIFGAPAHSAPKKQTDSAPAAATTPVSKPESAGKKKATAVKSKDEKAVAAEAKTTSATKTPATSGNRAAPSVASKTDAASPAAETTQPKKRGVLKRFFGGKQDTGEEKQKEAEPKLAKAKTARPAPVKDVKTAKPEETLADAEPEKKKGGLFGFFRRNRSSGGDKEISESLLPDEFKMERPADWQDRSIVKEDGIALYEYGPSQTHGPDARLISGTVVKVHETKRGWARVEVEGGRSGYMDAAALRSAAKDDFRDPVVVARQMASVSVSPEAWAPAAPPPDLPDQPGPTANDSALLLLPPLELEQKKP